MCDDERGLLRTICEQPDCDVPRLVYADWLEERGQNERAGFIRESVAHAESDNAWILQPHVYGNREWNANIGLGSGQYYYRRGLIAEIRCTLAEFMGGKCTRCRGGQIWNDILIPDGRCFVCLGTGTLPGLARTLFGEHPITRVVLTDRDPVFLHGSSGSRSAGYHFPVGDLWDGIPWDIYEHMPEMPYPSEEYATRFLSQGCVNYARSLHDLPLLTKEQVTA